MFLAHSFDKDHLEQVFVIICVSVYHCISYVYIKCTA